MSLLKRGKNSYRITIELPRDPVSGERARRVFTVKGSKKDAQAAERAELYRLEHGIDVAPDRLTTGEWINRWLQDHASRNVRPTTLRRYLSIGNRLISLIGQVRLQQLRPAHVDAAYLQLREDGLGVQTIAHYHRMLHGCLKAALRLQLIAVNPTDAVTPPKPQRHEAKALTPDQLRMLLESITDVRLRRIAEVAAATGTRIGELLAVRWSDVDLDAGRMRIERAMVYTPREGVSYALPKTDAGRRSISLAPMTIELLRTHRQEQLEGRMRCADTWEDNDLVWCDQIGRAIPPYMVSKPFSKAAQDANLAGVTFHSLRHTHATLLLRGGVPDTLAAARLGHANANVTRMVYQHVQTDLADGVADVVQRLLSHS